MVGFDDEWVTPVWPRLLKPNTLDQTELDKLAKECRLNGTNNTVCINIEHDGRSDIGHLVVKVNAQYPGIRRQVMGRSRMAVYNYIRSKRICLG